MLGVSVLNRLDAWQYLTGSTDAARSAWYVRWHWPERYWRARLTGILPDQAEPAVEPEALVDLGVSEVEAA